ncbi:DUF4189 domain-containing protein [Falsirhodobacter deserti]|uniref:DUF4189 domain-containing protein n=1 Tax=Falsirhodobacter deserti TaxID=1365611 RepID=UPI000FE3F628|nr:DUF4189 domain-containing protein [Falsirhodobacter deserti]
MKLVPIIGALGFVVTLAGEGIAGGLALQTVDQAPMSQPKKEERGIWAAIAYSDLDQKHGFFWGADKRMEAMDIAFEHCRNAGGETCKVVEVFRNHRHWSDDDDTGFPYHHCGALAIGDSAVSQITPWATKSAPTRREAEEGALAVCEEAGGSCKILEWVCT